MLEKLKGELSESLRWDSKLQKFVKPDSPRQGSARFLEHQPLAISFVGPLVDTPPSDWWLKGKDLEHGRTPTHSGLGTGRKARRPKIDPIFSDKRIGL